MLKTAVIGSGSWGTALAVLLGKKGSPVRLWARREELARAIERERENSQYLPGVKLPETVTATSDITQALAGSEAVVLAIPSAGVREVLALLKGRLQPDVLLVHAGKGL